MRIRQGTQLLLRGRNNSGVAVAEAGNGRSTATVQVAFSICVNDIGTIATRCAGRLILQVAM